MEIFKSYKEIRENAKKYFNELPIIKCSAVSEDINFSIEGFNHVIYKKGNVERNRVQQMIRFQLFPSMVKLISLTTTYQEYEEINKEFSVRRYGRRIKKKKLVRYWGIIAIIDEQKIKVILRKIGNGQTCFWSIIPSYATSMLRDGKYMIRNFDQD